MRMVQGGFEGKSPGQVVRYEGIIYTGFLVDLIDGYSYAVLCVSPAPFAIL